MSLWCCDAPLGERAPLVGPGQSADELFVRAGGFGRFQCVVALAVGLVQAFCAAIVMLPAYVPLVAEAEWGGPVSTTPMVIAFFIGQILGFPVWGLLAD
eukprot:5421988-Prymnesium_polylepis.1